MENISAVEQARELLAHCLAGTHWPEALVDRLIEDDASRALFGIVVEGLSDLFEPRLCDIYAELFSEVIGRVLPDDLHAPHLLARYRRIRRPHARGGKSPKPLADARGSETLPGSSQSLTEPRPSGSGGWAAVRNVFVLSRVTLGADVAVTSVALDGAKRAFPRAQIYFAGPQKSWELFAGDPGCSTCPCSTAAARACASGCRSGRSCGTPSAAAAAS